MFRMILKDVNLHTKDKAKSQCNPLIIFCFFTVYKYFSDLEFDYLVKAFLFQVVKGFRIWIDHPCVKNLYTDSVSFI